MLPVNAQASILLLGCTKGAFPLSHENLCQDRGTPSPNGDPKLKREPWTQWESNHLRCLAPNGHGKISTCYPVNSLVCFSPSVENLEVQINIRSPSCALYLIAPPSAYDLIPSKAKKWYIIKRQHNRKFG
jgi:hypothetical protein